jgi:hypothetical protein
MISKEDLWKLEGQKVKVFECFNKKGQLVHIGKDHIILKITNMNASFNQKIPISKIKSIKCI